MNLGLLERKKYESSMFHPNNSTCSSSRERERERERERDVTLTMVSKVNGKNCQCFPTLNIGFDSQVRLVGFLIFLCFPSCI
jgi:hypothetical protein